VCCRAVSAVRGHVQTASNFLLPAAKSALIQWTENSRSSRVDILSVIDVNKNKHVGK